MKVLVVDDEAPARARLLRLLDDVGEYTVVGEAGNGREALDIVKQDRPDIVLLDIRMPGMDGIETAQHLNMLESPPAVVFTTAYDEYAIDAFEANAIGYVLKPIRRERLDQALQQAARLSAGSLQQLRATSDATEQRKHVCARAQGELKLIPVADVFCFVADQKYVSVMHEGGQDLIDDSLKSLEDEFSDQFVRIHRGALVSLAAVDALKKTEDGRTRVMLRGLDIVDDLIVSRRHVANVKRRLKKG
ncbi:MAG: LytR/AlgR family response regulator transcription factor [Woeseiaceae bacterium]